MNSQLEQSLNNFIKRVTKTGSNGDMIPIDEMNKLNVPSNKTNDITGVGSPTAANIDAFQMNNIIQDSSMLLTWSEIR